MTLDLSSQANEAISALVQSLVNRLPGLTGSIEVYSGCEVTSLGSGSSLPRYITVRINDYTVQVLWRGSPLPAVSDEVSVLHFREGNRYEVLGISGSGGSYTPADIYNYVWVLDVTLGTLTPFNTINGALGYSALAAGDFILIAPGIYDESITLANGVVLAELVPGTVEIHATGSNTAATCVAGGYLNVQAIRCTRAVSVSTIDANIAGAGECIIVAEEIEAESTAVGGAVSVYAVDQSWNAGTLRIYAKRIIASGGRIGTYAVSNVDGTQYIHAEECRVLDDTITSCAAYSGGGSQYIFAECVALEGGSWSVGAYCDGGVQDVHGNCTGTTTQAGAFADGAFCDAGTQTIYGHCTGEGLDWTDGAYVDSGATQRVYGHCFATANNPALTGSYGAFADSNGTIQEIWGNAYATGGTESIGAHTESGSPTQRVNGDVTGDHYGAKCDGGAMVITNGVGNGATADFDRAAGTLHVFALESSYGLFTDGWDVSNSNIHLGVGVCGAGNQSGALNIVAVGYQSLYSLTSGDSNIAIGVDALYDLTTALENTAIGVRALSNNVTGRGNVAIGYQAGLGQHGNSCTGNMFIGSNTGGDITNGQYNVCIGETAGRRLTGGDYNMFIGRQSGFNTTTANNNVAIGRNALLQNVGGASNVCIGERAGENEQAASFNTYIGGQAGRGALATSGDNVGIGATALFSNTTGIRNTVVGRSAGYNLTTGTLNVFVGYQAGYNEAGSSKLYIESSNSSAPLIYGDFASDLVRLNGVTGLTNAIHPLFYLRHQTSGAASALFGVGEYHELEDSAGNLQSASETVTLWATATSGSESPLRRWTNYPQGSAGPGYCGFWTWNNLDNTARTVIPGGTGDVTGILTATYAVSESGGGTSGGTATVTPGSTVDIYDDGTDVFTITCGAGGDVTIARSAGASTADIALHLVWV